MKLKFKKPKLLIKCLKKYHGNVNIFHYWYLPLAFSISVLINVTALSASSGLFEAEKKKITQHSVNSNFFISIHWWENFFNWNNSWNAYFYLTEYLKCEQFSSWQVTKSSKWMIKMSFSPMMTCMPILTSCLVISKPIPLSPPVMMATRPRQSGTSENYRSDI